MRRINRVCLAICIGLLFTGCGVSAPILDRLWPDAYWRSERYVVLEIDTSEEMSLHFDRPDQPGANDELVPPTVFAVGSDSHHIVVKQHPAAERAGRLTPDRTTTNYYIIDRTDSLDVAARKAGVHGPLTPERFAELARAQALPAFSKVFPEVQ